MPSRPPIVPRQTHRVFYLSSQRNLFVVRQLTTLSFKSIHVLRRHGAHVELKFLKHIVIEIGAWSEITIASYLQVDTDESSLINQKIVNAGESVMDMRKKLIFPLRRVKKSSVTANSSIKDWITLTDLEGAQALGEERSRWGSSQQLKPPPHIKWCDDKSGRVRKRHLKKASSSQLGA